MIIIDDDLLEEFRRQQTCEWCHKKFARMDPNHLTTRGFGGGTRLDVRINLCSLCRTCHNLYHEGRITQGELCHVIAKREGLTAEQVMEAIYKLRNARKGTLP